MKEGSLKVEYKDKEGLKEIASFLRSLETEDPLIRRLRIEGEEEWHTISKRLVALPGITIPYNCVVKIAPPFCGAMCRMSVTDKDNDKNQVSIYCDFHNRLGWHTTDDKISPYWEIYAHRGDPERFDLEDINGLSQGIARLIEEGRKGNSETKEDNT